MSPALGAMALPSVRAQPPLWAEAALVGSPSCCESPGDPRQQCPTRGRTCARPARPALCESTGSLDSQAKTPYFLWPGLGFRSFLALLRESLLSFRAQSHTLLPLRCGTWCQLLSPPPASAAFVTAPRSVLHFDSSLLLSHGALTLGMWVVLSDSSAVLPLFFLPKACWSHFP